MTDKFQRLSEGDVRPLLRYLRRMHKYFLEFQFPRLRLQLVEYLKDSDVGGLIMKYFDEYTEEVSIHMKKEEQSLFVYVDRLIKGETGMRNEELGVRNEDLLGGLSKYHGDIESKFSEFTNIMQMYSTGGSNQLIEDTKCVEEDLLIHCLVEDMIFLPAVRALEKKKGNETEETNDTELSEREQDIVRCVAKGLSNKEIADKLFLSVNTVTTHRRNIAKKLHIHSPAALTIYCIVNKLIDIKEVRL